MKLQKVYFPGGEIYVPAFFRLPRPLFYHRELNKQLSNNAKLLYALLLDRMGLSVVNGWFDRNGQIYIYFSLAEICFHLNCSENTAMRLLRELDSKTGVGLIERVRQGLGKPDRIYVRLLEDMEQLP